VRTATQRQVNTGGTLWGVMTGTQQQTNKQTSDIQNCKSVNSRQFLKYTKRGKHQRHVVTGCWCAQYCAITGRCVRCAHTSRNRGRSAAARASAAAIAAFAASVAAAAAKAATLAAARATYAAKSPASSEACVLARASDRTTMVGVGRDAMPTSDASAATGAHARRLPIGGSKPSVAARYQSRVAG
jgi:hypothetical protein